MGPSYEAAGVIGRERSHCVGSSENVMPERRPGEGHVLKLIEDEVGGRVLVAGYLVNYDVALLVEFRCGECGADRCT